MTTEHQIENMANLAINSTPAGARVYLGPHFGTLTDQEVDTDGTFILTAGDYDIKLVLADHQDYIQTVTVGAGTLTTINVALIPTIESVTTEESVTSEFTGDILSMAVLAGWARRKLITIAGSTAGAQSDYQIKLVVNQGAGIDTLGSVYLGGNVLSNFGDLRFTKSDGSTLLNYWIESITGVSPNQTATVWIRLAPSPDTIPVSPGTYMFYIYYNNPTPPATGPGTGNNDGVATFQLFDDFLGATLDGTKWAVPVIAGTGSISIGGGYLTVNIPISAGSGAMVNSINSFTTPFAFSFRYQITPVVALTYPAIDISDATSAMTATANNGIGIIRSSAGRMAYNTVGGVGTSDPGLTNDTSFHKMDITATSSDIYFYEDNALRFHHVSNIPSVSIKFNIRGSGVNNTSTASLNVDYALVRKYISPEPAFYIMGTEEIGSCPSGPKYSGNTVTLQATPKDGTAPYYVEFRKDGVAINSARLAGLTNPITNAPEGVQITRVYTLDDVDIAGAVGGVMNFSVYITDVCPTGAKSCIGSCAVAVGCVAPTCNLTVV